MINELRLILIIPHSIVTATSLGIEGYARHRSPGSGKYFSGRTVFVDLAIKDDRPDFHFLDEGSWRDANKDAAAALDAVKRGKRTKTALSNMGFSCTPIGAYQRCFLVKTGGKILLMEPCQKLTAFTYHECNEGLSPDQVAKVIDHPSPKNRIPRLYMVFGPTHFMMLSNLTPEEYAWYATHRHGKVFRQVMFTELRTDQLHVAAKGRFDNARRELTEKLNKKTKTIAFEDCINLIPFREWVGYRREEEGGLYVADRNGISLWRFPATIPNSWDKAEG